MKNQSLMPLIIRLENLYVTVNAPDFKLTPAQEDEIAKWWQDRLDAEVARQLGTLERIEYCGKPLTHSKLWQIMLSASRLSSIRKADEQ